MPGDIALDKLHHVLQIAFGWTDSHLHVFDTDYGSFGRRDADLRHRPENSVTLEQVARIPGDKITYTYDFGDDWEHVIKIEAVQPREQRTSYPRCTAGRRASPPEDCGGVWGYGYLLGVLADPAHEEHAERQDWMGITDPAQFDPAAFDLAAINEALPVVGRARR